MCVYVLFLAIERKEQGKYIALSVGDNRRQRHYFFFFFVEFVGCLVGSLGLRRFFVSYFDSIL